jgi:hypothetical protein
MAEETSIDYYQGRQPTSQKNCIMPKRVAALAGRRIDASDAKVARFPLSEASRVRRELRELFIREQIEMLVCAAACPLGQFRREAVGPRRPASVFETER